MPNRFFLWLYSYTSPRQLDLSNLPPDLPASDLRYFVGILKHLDQLLPGVGLTFVLTWHLDDFHEVMMNAVILLVGDERHQTPSYQRRVKAIFKTGGVRRNPVGQTLQLAWPIAWRALLRDARNSLNQIERRWKYGPPGIITTQELPLGYCNLRDIDPLPIEQRPVDVFFAGVLAASGWTLRASVAARKQMATGVALAQQALPQHRIETLLASPVSNKRLSPEAYTQTLANAKIALTPRGNFDETFRLFEAAKLGCVIISDPLPQRWYYQGCPVISISKWTALPEVLSELLVDTPKLAEISQRTRQWWDSTLSEEAVARFVAQCLTSGCRVRPEG